MPTPTTSPETRRIIKFVYVGELPDFNKEINAAKGHAMAYKNTKERYTEAVAWECSRQLKGVRVEQFAVVCRWYTPNKRKDPDNVAFAIKYILDGFQWAGLIKNDGRKNVTGGILHQFGVDRQNPRVEVYLLENFTINIDFD